MFTKQNLLATLAGFVAMFLLGFVIWGVAFAGFFQAHSLADVMKDPPDLLTIALGNLVGTFAMSSLYGKWARGVHSIKEGFQFGLWIGLLIGVGLGLVWCGTSELMDTTGYVVEAILDLVFYGIIGAVIALIYKTTASK